MYLYTACLPLDRLNFNQLNFVWRERNNKRKQQERSTKTIIPRRPPGSLSSSWRMESCYWPVRALLSVLGRVSPNRRNHPDKKHHNIPAIEKLSRTSKSAARRSCSQYTCFETAFCNWTFRCSQITSITFVIHRIPNVETEWWDEIVAALSNPTAAWAKPLCLAGLSASTRRDGRRTEAPTPPIDAFSALFRGDGFEQRPSSSATPLRGPRVSPYKEPHPQRRGCTVDDRPHRRSP